jgi:hypothetical protein
MFNRCIILLIQVCANNFYRESLGCFRNWDKLSSNKFLVFYSTTHVAVDASVTTLEEKDKQVDIFIHKEL